MLAFAAAVSIGEPPHYPIIPAPLAITLFVAMAALAYWFGFRNAPSWLKIVTTTIWPVSLALLAFTASGQCCWDDPLCQAQQNWIGVPAFALAVASPVFLARAVTKKHVYAVLVALCFILIGVAIFAGVAIALPPYECAVA